MASIKDLKKRISTVKNTQQTTRAMKMVSAAKLRRAQEAITNQRPYAIQMKQLVQKLAIGLPGDGSQFPLLRAREVQDTEKRVLLIVVTSDRGLCGGFNGSIIKATQRWVQQRAAENPSIELAFVGRRGFDFFKSKLVRLGQHYSRVSGKVTFAQARELAQDLVDRFLKEEVDEVKFIYNEFKNAATQKVVVEDFLPYQFSMDQSGAQEAMIKPSQQEILNLLLSKTFAVQVFRILLESQASEHGARMSAMENATKNAGEMIRKLTLQYNKQRQAGITKELLEIISGSESQKA